MRIGVVPCLVTGKMDISCQLRMPGCFPTDEEKGGTNPVPFQDLQDRRGTLGVGAVVEGQGHVLVMRAACPDHVRLHAIVECLVEAGDDGLVQVQGGDGTLAPCPGPSGSRDRGPGAPARPEVSPLSLASRFLQGLYVAASGMRTSRGHPAEERRSVMACGSRRSPGRYRWPGPRWSAVCPGSRRDGTSLGRSAFPPSCT